MSADPAPLRPAGPELARLNRQEEAERLEWPDGVLEACERLDKKHIGWYTTWQRATATRKESGFYGVRRGRSIGEPAAYGETPEVLSARMATWPWGKNWI